MDFDENRDIQFINICRCFFFKIRNTYVIDLKINAIIDVRYINNPISSKIRSVQRTNAINREEYLEALELLKQVILGNCR